MKIEANFESEQFNKVRVKGRTNPLTGNIADNQAVFDAFPEALREKIASLITELNNALSNVDNTADVDKPLSNDGINKLEELKSELKDLISQSVADLVGEAPETLDTLEEISKALGDNKNAATEMLRLIGGKVDKVAGKGLSTNDFTNEDKTKLDELNNYDDTAIKDELKKYADDKAAEIVNSSPEALDTLKELAEALGNDANFAANVLNILKNKVDKEDGKKLSTEDFTTAEKEKLAGLENYKLPSDVVQDAKYVHTDNNYTTAEKEKLAGLENYDDTDIKNNKADIDEMNLKLYGTTDVHILTDDDVWIVGGILEAQKRPIIEHDVVIIPYGVRNIYPKYPDYDDDSGNVFYPDGTYPIYIKAKKIIFPSTLVNIYGCIDYYNNAFDMFIVGECILNEGIEIINLVNGTSASGATFGKVTIPQTLKTFAVWDYHQDIVIPSNVDKFSFWAAYELEFNLYVYNPDFDFSSFEVGQVFSSDVYETDGVVYGYAGSTAEAFAKEHGYTFVNIGSDCTPFIYPLNTAEATILANEYYTFTGISSLTVTLDTASTTKLDEFMFSFETPSDVSAFSFGVLTDEAVEIKWIKEPNLKPDYIYEVSVVNGVGVIAGTAKEVA